MILPVSPSSETSTLMRIHTQRLRIPLPSERPRTLPLPSQSVTQQWPSSAALGRALSPSVFSYSSGSFPLKRRATGPAEPRPRQTTEHAMAPQPSPPAAREQTLARRRACACPARGIYIAAAAPTRHGGLAAALDTVPMVSFPPADGPVVFDAMANRTQTVRREVWTGIWSCSSAPNNGTMFFSWCCGDLESCCENAIPREALDIGTAFAAGTDVILERLGGGDTDSADDTSSVPGAAASSTSPSNADATTLGSGGSPTADSGTLNPTCVATTNNVRTSLGAGLGVPLAVSLIALAVVSTLLWRERRRHRGTYPTKPGDDSASPDSAARAGAPPPMARHGAYGANAAAVGAGGAYAPRPSHEASPDRNGVSPGAEREAWHSRGGADSASVNRAASNRDRHGGAASRNGAGWYGGQGSDGASTSSRARGPESPNGGSDQNTLLSGGSHYPAELGGEHLTRAELWGSEKK